MHAAKLHALVQLLQQLPRFQHAHCDCLRHETDNNHATKQRATERILALTPLQTRAPSPLHKHIFTVHNLSCIVPLLHRFYSGDLQFNPFVKIEAA